MYKRLRFTIRYIGAFISKHYLALLVGILLSVLFIYSAPRFISLFPQLRVNRHIALIGRYTISNLPLSIQSKMSIGLTVIGPDDLPGPGLASSWEAKDGGKTVIFHLNTDLRWQDNTPLVSSEIQYLFRDAKIEYPDPQTIVFRLQDPYSPLTSLVSKPIFKQSKSRFNRNPIVAGSYQIHSYKQNGNILETLTLSPTHPDNHLPYLTYHFYSSPQQARIAFKLGEVEQISDISDLNELSDWPNTTVVPTVQFDRYVAVFFNTEDPLLSGSSGKNLRLALAYATSKPVDDTRALGPISPSSWSYNPDVKKYDYDLDKARELMGKVEKKPEKLTIRTLPAYIDEAETVKNDWEKLGINVEIISQTELPTDFQVALVAQAIPVDPDQYIYWHSTQATTNITRLNNPRIDKLLEDGRKTWDLQSRKKIYQDFQKYLVEEMPAIFLYHPITYTIIRK